VAQSCKQKPAAAGATADVRELPITRLTGVLFVRVVKNFAKSEGGGHAIALFATLIALLLAVARVILSAPRFVILDRLHKSLDAEEPGRVHQALADKTITYVTIGNGEARTTGRYGAELVLDVDGPWQREKRAGAERD
jgi:hypothetical protein